MEKNKEKITDTQGVEVKKKQAISKTYTLTQFGAIIIKLRQLGWIDNEERETLLKLREKVKQEYIKGL